MPIDRSLKQAVGRIACIAALALCACSPEQEDDPQAEADPLEIQALNDQLMVDPDLVNQNESAAALTGSLDHSLPSMNVTRDAIAAAREEATVLAGGNAKMLDLPEPEISDSKPPMAQTITALARAASTAGGSPCAESGQYGAVWAARLPEEMPIYPRGSTQDAAGSDAGDCSLRSVNFLTPVPLNEILSFYLTRAAQADIAATYRVAGEEHILTGMAKGRSFAVHAHSLPSGVTDVDLVTSGF